MKITIIGILYYIILYYTMFKKKSTYVSYGNNLSYDWLNSSHYRMLFTVD